MVNDFTPESEPFPGAKTWDKGCDDLAFAHLDFGSCAVIRFKVCVYFGRFVIHAVHSSRSGAMRTGDNAIVRMSRVLQEGRLAGDVTQQNPGRNDHKIRLTKCQ